MNEVKATTTYQDTKLDFAANLKQPDRDVDVSGDVVFHPDHQEIHLPSLALRTQGVSGMPRRAARPRSATETIGSNCWG